MDIGILTIGVLGAAAMGSVATAIINAQTIGHLRLRLSESLTRNASQANELKALQNQVERLDEAETARKARVSAAVSQGNRTRYAKVRADKAAS